MAAHPIHDAYPNVSLSVQPGLPSLKHRFAGEKEQTRGDGSNARPAHDSRSRDIALAREILSEFGDDSIILEEVDEALIRFRLDAGANQTLEHVIFARPCLQKLAADPVRNVKIEYLQRDIERSATHRHTYAYPHSLWALLDD